MQQEQFLDVIDRDEAQRRFEAVLDLGSLEEELIPLREALGRVLAEDICAPIDVPGFDRANVDGFAVRAEDTFKASEENPCRLKLVGEILGCGQIPRFAVSPERAVAVATGVAVPRGADGVVMIEQTDAVGDRLIVRKPVSPGANITFAGTDIGRGETVLRRGQALTARETGVLAALGLAQVSVVRRPRVAILSTGNELLKPGSAPEPGKVFDSNAVILADTVRELGGDPIVLGIVPDNEEALTRSLNEALHYDVIVLSGGTSKGPGDLSYRAVARLGAPGIVVHGVALKPGKPLCLGAVKPPFADRKPVPIAVLPGFPTSAIFTFREFVAPVIERLGGRSSAAAEEATAILPMRVNSERGRTEYLLVNLVRGGPNGLKPDLLAYPMGKGSGSVTTFSKADGYVVIPRQREYLEAGDKVAVHLLSRGLRFADLVVMGSQCTGLDYLLGRLREKGIESKFLAVGSTAGLAAARRGECDVAGIHLFDEQTGEYNRPFLGDDLRLLTGYGRLQGVVCRKTDSRFNGATSAHDVIGRALALADCAMVNRNRGSGTRILIDGLLGSARPPGYLTETRSHHAVAAAVIQERADWGVAIEPVTRGLELAFYPLQEEHYDFAVPANRWENSAVKAFRELLGDPETGRALRELGFSLTRLRSI